MLSVIFNIFLRRFFSQRGIHAHSHSLTWARFEYHQKNCSIIYSQSSICINASCSTWSVYKCLSSSYTENISLPILTARSICRPPTTLFWLTKTTEFFSVIIIIFHCVRHHVMMSSYYNVRQLRHSTLCAERAMNCGKELNERSLKQSSFFGSLYVLEKNSLSALCHPLRSLTLWVFLKCCDDEIVGRLLIERNKLNHWSNLEMLVMLTN
jgi:hypothetical protein